jgi:hypothetical protein
LGIPRPPPEIIKDGIHWMNERMDEWMNDLLFLLFRFYPFTSLGYLKRRILFCFYPLLLLISKIVGI